MKLSNSKTQIPNKFQSPKFKMKTVSVIMELEFGNYLEFGN